MLTRDEILGEILQREGWPAVTDRAADRGGLTKGGVTLTNLNRWRHAHGHGPLTREQLPSLTEAEARRFLAEEFFRPLEFVAVDSERLFVFLADWAVMSGPDNPIKALQRTLQVHGKYLGAIDGVAGPKTLIAWAQYATKPAHVTSMMAELVARRVLAHLDTTLDAKARAFMASEPTTQLHNLRGWVRRALSFLGGGDS